MGQAPADPGVNQDEKQTDVAVEPAPPPPSGGSPDALPTPTARLFGTGTAVMPGPETLRDLKEGTWPVAGGGDEEPLVEIVAEVLAGVRSIRQLIDTRTDILQACRSALDERYVQASHQWSEYLEQQMGMGEQLAQREAALEYRENRCLEVEQQVEQFAQQHQAEMQKLRKRERKLQSRVKEALQKNRLLDDRQADLAGLEKQLADRRGEIDDRGKMLEEGLHKLEESRGELAEVDARAERERAEVQQRQDKLVEEMKELRRERKQMRLEQEAIAQQHEAVNQDLHALHDSEAELAALSSSLETKRKELDEQQTELNEVSEAWKGRISEVNEARDRLMAFQKQVSEQLQSISVPDDDLFGGPVPGLDGGGDESGEQPPPGQS